MTAYFQRLGLHLTNRCQLDCAHCLRDPGLEPRDLSLETIEKTLDAATSLYGIRQVSLTGGEPTLHPLFQGVIDAIARSGSTWDMVTNGHRLPNLLRANPALLASCTSVTFSVDGATESVHDSIRGKGSFRRVLPAISVAAVQQVPFGVQMTVNAVNLEEIEALGLLAAQLGAKHVSFAMMQPTGTHHDSSLFLPAQTWWRVRERVEALSRVLKIAVVLPEGHPSKQPMALCGPLRGETLHVDVSGRLTLCCLHSEIPSNREIQAGSIDELGLPAAHKRLLPVISEAIDSRLDRLANGPARNPWDEFSCNGCLQHFGKPYWNEGGAEGPPAVRARWGPDNATTPRQAKGSALRVVAHEKS